MQYSIAKFLGTFFYVGYSPKAPGTAGSLVALPIAWYLWMLPTPVAYAIILATFLIGVWAAHVVVVKTGKEDPQIIVIDEVVGIFITTAVATHVWWQYALAFLFFRIFDITKPGPIGLVDKKVKGGFGAMADDLVAGIVAALMLYLVLLFSGRMISPAAA